MGMFDTWFPKGTPVQVVIPELQTLEVVPENPQQFIYPVLNDYRKGMWVKTEAARIGILDKFLDNGLAQVALTDASGLNVGMVEYSITSLTRAKQSEIPNERIKHLSRNDLRALGYED